PKQRGTFMLSRSMGVQYEGPLDLHFLDSARPEMQTNYQFFFTEPNRLPQSLPESERSTIEKLGLNYYIPCCVHEQPVAVIGLGKTVDGDYLSSDDVELLVTIASYVAIAADNTRLYESLEQKAMQVERLKDFSENIVESLKVGVLAVDLDGRVDSWNTQLENLIGVTRSAAIDKKLEEVFPPDLVAELSARNGEQAFGIYKFHLRNGAGRHIVTNVTVAPLVDKAGEKQGRLIVMEDVTQRVQLEEQLLQTEKLTSLGLLAAGVAHEVNTPLAVISNYTQMLARQFKESDPNAKIVDKIVKQTFRASEIVNNLLNFSRTGAAELTEVNVNSVIDETLSLVAHPFKTARVNVLKSLESTLPPVMGSPNKLQQVFLNLFINARDAMPHGGMLEVRSWAHNGSVEVEVTDTGVGIPRELLGRIFDPFFTTKATGRGTGLGLSVSYGIIKEHAGTIDVRSTPGKGTAFRLEFPVARKPVNV
ncbi:MAG: PAS domain S-box protein, partial [Acidobacteria bacterium]|nr:PAS domain S-box protein [Acidobacteriota bacterium]